MICGLMSFSSSRLQAPGVWKPCLFVLHSVILRCQHTTWDRGNPFTFNGVRFHTLAKVDLTFSSHFPATMWKKKKSQQHINYAIHSLHSHYPWVCKEIKCSKLSQPSLIIKLGWELRATQTSWSAKSNKTCIDIIPTTNPVIRVLAPAFHSVPRVGQGKTSRARHGGDSWTEYNTLQVHCWSCMVWLNLELI